MLLQPPSISSTVPLYSVSIPQAVSAVATLSSEGFSSLPVSVSIPQAVSAVATKVSKEAEGLLSVSIPQAVSAVATLEFF